MRILFLLSSLERGGAERVASLLCSAWANDGHQVVVIPTFAAATREAANCFSPRVSVRPISELISGLPNWPKKMRAIRREMVSGDYDIVCSYLTNVNILALAAGLGVRCPVVVSERTYPPLFAIPMSMRLGRRLLYPFAKRVVMQTQRGLEWLDRNVPGAKGVVLPNPVQYPLTNGTPYQAVEAIVSPEQRVLLTVGRLADGKRVDWLIAQFAELAADHWQWTLVVLGEGPERAKCEELIRKFGLEDRVRLIGDTGNLHDWYQRADAYVTVSRFEGYPNALAEAISYALPTLAVDCPTGPAELMRDGKNGILLHREANDRSLREGLQKLLTTRFPATEDVAHDIRSDLNLSTIASAWLDLFQIVIRETKSA